MIFSLIAIASMLMALEDTDPIKMDLLFLMKSSCMTSFFESIDICASFIWVLKISLSFIANVQDFSSVLSWTISKSISWNSVLPLKYEPNP